MINGSFRGKHSKDTIDEYWELTKSCVAGMLLLAGVLAGVAVLAAVLQPRTDGSDLPAWTLILGLFTAVLVLIIRATRQYGRFRRLAARDRRAQGGVPGTAP